MSTSDKLTRIAIVNADKCKPKKCRQECKRSCPVVRMGKLCIEVAPTSKIAWISEELCIGCGICVKVTQHTTPHHTPHYPSQPPPSSPPAAARLLLTDRRCDCCLHVPCCSLRNVRSRPSRSSTCPRTWSVTPPTAMDPTRSSCTAFPCRDPDRCWDWWVPTVLVSCISTQPTTASEWRRVRKWSMIPYCVCWLLLLDSFLPSRWE